MLGFVIVSHNNPDQLFKLIGTLNQLYNYPPIACHHDFSQSKIDLKKFSYNVSFVVKYIRTSWGDWSVTGAVLKAIELLFEKNDPQWFTLLSTADYPITGANKVYSELRSSKADAFLDLRPIYGSIPNNHFGIADPNLSQHDNIPLAIKRYMHARVTIPSVAQNLIAKLQVFINKPTTKVQNGYRLPFSSPIGPFDSKYRCFVGSQWFTGNRRIAMKLINPNFRDLSAYKHLKMRWHADESYVNTVLGNDPSILIDIDPRRYSRWQPGNAHPSVITENDFVDMIASGKHYARKFIHDSSVVRMLDEYLGLL